MNSTIRTGKGLLPVLVFGLAVGFLSTFGCGDNGHAPNLHIVGDKTVYEVYESESLVITMGASDPDGDALSFSVIRPPPGSVLDDDPYDCCTASFKWTPDYGQADIYNVVFKVSDGQLSDSEMITITVNKAKNIGAAYTGIYPAIAYDFHTFVGKDGFNCEDGMPAPGCEWFPLFLVQNDDIIFVSLGDELYSICTIAYDGRFIMEMGIDGFISADKIEGSIFYATPTHAWGFGFIAPIPASNVTVTVEDFTGHGGEYVYVFVDEEVLAMGGSEIVDGSAIIQPIPELPDGPYTILVVVDTDGNIEEGLMGGIGPISDGDWVANEILTIREGSGKAILNKLEHFEEVK